MSKHTNRWSENDRQAFADGVRLRAQTIRGRRWDGPTEIEWDGDRYEPADEFEDEWL